MGYSRIETPFAGGSQVFPATFSLGYLNRADVTAYVQGEIDVTGSHAYRPFTWVDADHIQITGTLPNPCVLVTERTVSKNVLVANLGAGGDVTRSTVDRAVRQLMMISHELLDGRIASFSELSLLTGFVAAGVAAKTASEAARDITLASQALALSYKDTAYASQVAAAASAVAAAASAAAAAGSASTFTANTRYISGNTTLTAADAGSLIVINAGAGPVVITLPPTASFGTGKPGIMFAKNDGSTNLVTVVPNGAETINGSNTPYEIHVNRNVYTLRYGPNITNTGFTWHMAAPFGAYSWSDLTEFRGPGGGNLHAKILASGVDLYAGGVLQVAVTAGLVDVNNDLTIGGDFIAATATVGGSPVLTDADIPSLAVAGAGARFQYETAAPGTYPQTTFAAVPLNVTKKSGLGITLSGNTLTFSTAGTYAIDAVIGQRNVTGSNRTSAVRLYNTTTAAQAVMGTGAITADGSTTPHFIKGEFTVSAGASLQVQGVCNLSALDIGANHALGTSNVHSIVEFWRVA